MAPIVNKPAPPCCTDCSAESIALDKPNPPAATEPPTTAVLVKAPQPVGLTTLGTVCTAALLAAWAPPNPKRAAIIAKPITN